MKGLSKTDMSPVYGSKSTLGEEKDVKISVVVPVFNVSKYLRECLDSIVNQTLREIEVICGDGGSSDGSLEILHEYAAHDRRIRVICREGSGYGQSVNECMDVARGKYIGIVESDDAIKSEACDSLYSIAEDMGVDWVRADIYYYYPGNYRKLQKESIISGYNFYNAILNPQTDYRPYKSGMRTWSGIYNRDFLNRHNIRHNETPGGSYQDVGFYLKTLYYATRVCFLDKAFYMWRQNNPGSSIHYDSEKLVEKSFTEWHLNKEYLDHHPELGARAVASYHYRKFLSYIWTIEKADEADRSKAFKRAVEEFREAVSRRELDKGFFERWEWDKLQEMINNSDGFYNRYFRHRCEETILLKRLVKAILKSMIKPIPKHARMIAYRLMGDAECFLERKIQYVTNWNRQQLEDPVSHGVAKTAADVRQDLERTQVDLQRDSFP